MGGGESGVGARAGCFCAACFLTAAGGAATGSAAAGRGAAACALAAGEAERSADGFDPPVPGSAVMMLTGGIEDALGNSALVGRPVGTDGPSAATGAGAGAASGGAFHDDA